MSRTRAPALERIQEHFPRPHESQGNQIDRLYKYKYQEFRKFLAGERLLENILRKILPLALFETWKVLSLEDTAYLSVASLAEARERSPRKIQMDLDELQRREILSIRYERKIFCDEDGTFKEKPVAIKDFEPLYDLAYEYLIWSQSEDYIPPERSCIELIRKDASLTAKLMRFENYRRLLCNKKPGPQEKESTQW